MDDFGELLQQERASCRGAGWHLFFVDYDGLRRVLEAPSAADQPKLLGQLSGPDSDSPHAHTKIEFLQEWCDTSCDTLHNYKVHRRRESCSPRVRARRIERLRDTYWS